MCATFADGVRRRSYTAIQVTVWPEDHPCERKWFLENIPGADAVLVMLSEKVRATNPTSRAHPLTGLQMDKEAFDTGGRYSSHACASTS